MATCRHSPHRSISQQIKPIQSELTTLKQLFEEHVRTMNQRVGNLSASFNAVHKDIAKCTNEQAYVSRTLQEQGAGLTATQKNIGHVHSLVSNLWTKNKDNDKLVENNRSLASALQEMQLERRESLSLLDDSEARLKELEHEKALLLQEVEKLRAENSAMRVREGERMLLESVNSQRYMSPAQPTNQFASGLNYPIKRKY